MKKISARDSAYAIREELQELRKKRNRLEDFIESLNLKMVQTNVGDKKRLQQEIDNLNADHDYVEYQISEKEKLEDQYDPTRPARRQREQKEIAMLGFTMVEHGEHQFNNRFEPYRDRTGIMKILYDSGLGSKIPNHRHHIIKIMDNFYVAVEDYKVLTFRYDNWYYDKYNGHPPKFKLPI